MEAMDYTDIIFKILLISFKALYGLCSVPTQFYYKGGTILHELCVPRMVSQYSLGSSFLPAPEFGHGQQRRLTNTGYSPCTPANLDVNRKGFLDISTTTSIPMDNNYNTKRNMR